jgi:hypothetical protein
VGTDSEAIREEGEVAVVVWEENTLLLGVVRERVVCERLKNNFIKRVYSDS